MLDQIGVANAKAVTQMLALNLVTLFLSRRRGTAFRRGGDPSAERAESVARVGGADSDRLQ